MLKEKPLPAKASQAEYPKRMLNKGFLLAYVGTTSSRGHGSLKAAHRSSSRLFLYLKLSCTEVTVTMSQRPYAGSKEPARAHSKTPA